MSTNYRLPQVQVFQDIVGTSTTSVRPLRPLVLGGHAQLVRFAEAGEREDGLLGYYDDAVDTPYAWPTRPAGGVVDRGSVRLHVLDGLLEYWASSIDSGPAVRKVAGHRNRVRADAVDFATRGAYDRDASLYDRDVKAGDVARVRYVGDDGAATLWTYVRDLVGDAVAAVVGAGVKASANAATQALSATVSQTAGDVNTVAASASGTYYDGLATGHINETYTIVVLDGSSGGDFTTARLRVLSASGTDDVAECAPAAAGHPTDIGTRGLRVTFSLDHLSAHSDSAEAEGVSPVDFLTGQRWTATVHQAFTAPAPTAGGVYAGAADTTYVITVVKGGRWADSPQVKVTTVTGSDVSGPTVVPGAAQAVAVGTKSVTVSFSGTALRAGDVYFVPVTAATTGHARTLVLGHNLPSGVADGELVGVTLYARRTVEVPEDREGYAPEVNWSASATQVTAKSGIVLYDAEFTDGGVPRPLALKADAAAGYGRLYAEYRVWLQGLAGAVATIAPEDALDVAIAGVLHPDNPLKYAVAKARANAARPDATGDLAIKALAVGDPGSVDSWQDALDILAGADGFYRVVPLTKDPAILSLVQAHVESFSTPDEALWRTAIFSLPALPRLPLVHAGSDVPGHVEATTADGAVALWVIEDDAQSAGTQYTIARCTTGNAKAVANGVRPGDVLRTGYATDGFGHETFDEYVVDAVLSEDELRLVAGAAGPVSVAVRGEVWRDLDADGEADAVSRIAGAYGSSRVCAVWPDRLEADGQVVEGYFLCAAIAGLTGAVLPHQGVTRMEVKGFTAVPRTTSRFNRTQLNRMAGSGVWIVAQDAATGMIFNRHAITTAPYDQVALREEMRQRNRDSVSYRARDYFAPYIGVTNAVESVDDKIRLDFKIWRDTMLHELETTDLGGQLVDATLRRLGPYAALPDTRVLVIECVEPNPLNNFYVHLVIAG